MNHRLVPKRIGALLFSIAVPASGMQAIFPSDAVIDITKPPYSADNTGARFVDTVLQRAISELMLSYQTLYFPSGTYKIGRPLAFKDEAGNWKAGLSLVGQDMATTTLLLPDSCAGFQDTANPKAMLYTASGPSTNYNVGSGGGDGGFRNYIRNITFSTGRRNPGAIGLSFIASNLGGIRDVVIRSGDGAGRIGLDLTRPIQGPYLIKRLSVFGFAYGIDIGDGVGVTLEHVSLADQTVCGIRNRDNAVAIRDLRSDNNVDAVRSERRAILPTLLIVNGKFAGKSRAPAIRTDGFLFTREISCTGCDTVLRCGAEGVAGKVSREYHSHPGPELFKDGKDGLGLAVRETPEWFDADTAHWANVLDYGADPSDTLDDADGIQRAIDSSGRPVVYFPRKPGAGGDYRVGKTIEVRGKVRMIYGAGVRIMPMTYYGRGYFSSPESPQALFRVNTSKDIRFDNLLIGQGLKPSTRSDGLIVFEHATARTMTLANTWIFTPAKAVYVSRPGAGNVFLEDVCTWTSGQVYTFGPGQKVWARQLNPEGFAGFRQKLIVNNGADLWIFGLKSEKAATVIETNKGGRTELLGGFLLPTDVDVPPDSLPAFVNNDARTSLYYSQLIHYTKDGVPSRYKVHVRDTRRGVTKLLEDPAAYSRTNFYNGWAPLPAKASKSGRRAN